MSQPSTGEPATSDKATQTAITTDREQLEHETAVALSNNVYTISSDEEAAETRSHHYHQLIDILPRYSDTTLHRLIAAAPLLDTVLRYLLFVTRPNEDYLNDWMTAEPIAVKEIIDSEPVIQGLHRYETLTPQKDGTYPARRVDQVGAIARVTAHFLDLGYGIEYGVNDQGFNIQYIEDENLRDFLTTHENPGAVADLIIERGITDVQQLTALLRTMDHTFNAVHDGVL